MLAIEIITKGNLNTSRATKGVPGNWIGCSKAPRDKREESLLRITRNHRIYLSIFYKKKPLTVKIIYEIQPAVLLQETERQLDRSNNEISHVGFSEDWAKTYGRIIYQDKIRI